MPRNLILVVVVAMLLSLTVTGIAAAAGPVSWSYEGETGPAYWGSLSPDFALCSTAKSNRRWRSPPRRPSTPGT